MFWDRNPGLRDHWLLADLPIEAVQPLLYVGRMLHFVPDQIIFWEGAAPDGLYLILNGAVQVSAISMRAEVLLVVASRNDLLGEMGVLDGEPRSGTARALEPTTAYFIPSESFLDLLERSSVVSMRLLALLTTRLRRSNRRLCELPTGGAASPDDPPCPPEAALAD